MKKWIWLVVTAASASAHPMASPAVAQQVELIAHRGESADAPENTLSSVNLAWERDVPGVEIDVRLTRDGRLVLMHDANAERTTGVDLLVEESTLEQYEGLDAGSWKASRWADEPVPTLKDVLATVPEDGKLYIEVKVGAEAIPALERAIELYARDPDRLVIISFQEDAIAAAKREMPEIPAYYLASFQQDSASGEWSPTLDELIRTARDINADGLDLSVKGPVDAQFVQRVKDAGLGMYVWTVDDPAVARRLVEAGVEGITTNRAAALREDLDQN